MFLQAASVAGKVLVRQGVQRAGCVAIGGHLQPATTGAVAAFHSSRSACGSEQPETFVADFHSPALVDKVNYKKLGATGMHVSPMGLGTSAFGGVYDDVNDAECAAITQNAIRLGVNYIDTAPWYGQGQAETVLGKALQGIPRKAYHVVTKVGRYEQDIEHMFDFTPERVVASVHESLERIGIDYLDGVLVHDAEFAPSNSIILSQTLPALAKLKEEGLVKAIGIAAYPLRTLRTIIELSDVPLDLVQSYCQYTLHNQALETQLMPLLRQRPEIGLVNAAPLSMGLLTSAFKVPDWHPATAEIRQACANAVQYCRAQGIVLERLAVLHSLAHPEIATTLISSSNAKEMMRNVSLMTEELSEADEDTIVDLHRQFFAPLKNANWEGVEETRYWSELGRVLQHRRLYDNPE